MKRCWRWTRRWYRILIPVTIAVALIVVTAVAHIAQSVDITDPTYLDPASTAPLGGESLAGRLRAAGVDVVPVTSTEQALAEVGAGDTLFVPAASLMRPDLLAELGVAANGARLVLVAPSGATLSAFVAASSASHWATQVADPGCRYPAAVAAGPATVDGVEYGFDGAAIRCYDDSLIVTDAGSSTLIVAGASDPFRNDHIGAAGNARLAVGLLGGDRRVVWLNLHHAEPLPPATTGASPTPSHGAPSYQPSGTDTGDPGNQGGSGSGSGGGNQDSGSQSTLPELFPAWLWATIGLAALCAVALALAAARRLGPPVSEPIPVAARSNEIVEGRGRLYRASRDRPAAFRLLRRAATDRLAAVAGLGPKPGRDEIVDAFAARTGRHRDAVTTILYADDTADGQTPLAHDVDLVAAVAALDDLSREAGL